MSLIATVVDKTPTALGMLILVFSVLNATSNGYAQPYPSHPPRQANLDVDASGWLAEYQNRIATRANDAVQSQPTRLPDIGGLWWDAMVKGRSELAPHQLKIGMRQIVEGALRHSSYVQVISNEPLIRNSSVVAESAAFDWRMFLDTTYKDTSEPVGNSLTTGNNADRFLDQTWSEDLGFRKRNIYGGEFEYAHRFGYQDNNSLFLSPKPQGTSQLELRYTQPLLNGAGQAYNESRIVLAQIDANAAHDGYQAKLQDHLLSVTEAYWELYGSRAQYFQRQKLLSSARAILNHLQGRREVDVSRRQILRASAAVASRQSEIARTRASIRNTESRLRLLVNDPQLLQLAGSEFTPDDSPVMHALPFTMEASLHTALLNRPDISEAIRSVRASAVQLGVAKNEILPKLDVLVSTYVSGLQGNADIHAAYRQQFTDGRPSYAVGFQFEVPVGNRVGQARLHRRELQMRRSISEFRLTVEEALTDVELAVREVQTTHQELGSKYEAMLAVESESRYLWHRWREVPGVNDSATLLLENLLDAQERVADEEAALVRAQVRYVMAIAALKREMGVLLRVHPTEAFSRAGTGNSPLVRHRPAEQTHPAYAASQNVNQPAVLGASVALDRRNSEKEHLSVPARSAIHRSHLPNTHSSTPNTQDARSTSTLKTLLSK